jgi:hypothetical protein
MHSKGKQKAAQRTQKTKKDETIVGTPKTLLSTPFGEYPGHST